MYEMGNQKLSSACEWLCESVVLCSVKQSDAQRNQTKQKKPCGARGRASDVGRERKNGGG